MQTPPYTLFSKQHSEIQTIHHGQVSFYNTTGLCKNARRLLEENTLYIIGSVDSETLDQSEIIVYRPLRNKVRRRLGGYSLLAEVLGGFMYFSLEVLFVQSSPLLFKSTE